MDQRAEQGSLTHTLETAAKMLEDDNAEPSVARASPTEIRVVHLFGLGSP